MFEYISGQLTAIHPTYLVLDHNGIGYKLLFANPFRLQDSLNQPIKLFVEQVIREDAHTLYGFLNLEEKQLFLTLNKVSGIGPKSALSILAADDHQGLVQAIETGDSTYLTKFPGVGKKTAQQMILDLKGELSDWEGIQRGGKADPSSPLNKDQAPDLLEEVSLALEGLGYSAREVSKIQTHLKEANIQSTQEGLSLAFKLLLK